MSVSLANQITFMKSLIRAKQESCAKLVNEGKMKQTEATTILSYMQNILESLWRLSELES